MTRYKKIEAEGKQEEFMEYLQAMFIGDTPTITEVNDLLWFDDDTIFEDLEIEIKED